MTRKTILLFISTVEVLLTFGQATYQRQIVSESSTVIKGVNVITMTTPNVVIMNATVVVSGKNIKSINGAIPKDALIVSGHGKWLIPGLVDSHVHLPTDTYLNKKSPIQEPDLIFNTQDIMTPFIANGVTSVLDLNSTPHTFAQKKEIQKGYVVGPRILLAALIDGGEAAGRIANTAQEGRLFVRSAKIEGYDVVKVYSHLNIETYQAIIDEAGRQKIKIVGHIPDSFRGKVEKAFIPNFDMVAHAEEFAKNSESFSFHDAEKFAKLSKDNDTWFTPTLIAMVWIARQSKSLDGIINSPNLKYVHPLLQSKWITSNNYYKNATKESTNYFNKMVSFHNTLVKIFNDTGVPIVAGTDTGLSGVIAGFSLHDELELLVEAGLTPEQALIAATLAPARWLGIEDAVGSIEVGKMADLILLDENPLNDIKNIRRIAGVFVNGTWLSKKKLDEMLRDLAARNTTNRGKFDWKSFTGKQ